MIIDDNSIDIFIHKKLIMPDFAEKMKTFTSCISALKYIRNTSNKKDATPRLMPSLILLNINMPLMDGFGFIKEFGKLNERLRNYTRIIIVTASINPADKEKAMKSKYVLEYINKPLTVGDLKRIQQIHN